MSETETKPTEKTFTQDEVDRIVKERLERFGKKFEDYDDLKAKAEASKSLEDRIAELGQQMQQTQVEKLRSDVAAEFKISTEDRDLFLTGSDAETLTAQAKRLSERTREQSSNANVAPLQGHQPTREGGSDELREFTRNLFNKGDE